MTLRKLAYAVYRDFFSNKKITGKKNDNFDIAQNIEAVLITSTHNLCFGSKIRKIGIPLQTPVLLYKSGV